MFGGTGLALRFVMTDNAKDAVPPIGVDDPRNKLATGLFLSFWVVLGWLSLLNNTWIMEQDFGLDPGPGLLPSIVLSIITLGASGQIALGIIGIVQGRSGRPIRWGEIARQSVFPGLLLLSLLTYVPLVRLISFIPATALLAAAWMIVIDRKRWRQKPLSALPSTVLGTVLAVGFVYLLFIYAIGVPLR